MVRVNKHTEIYLSSQRIGTVVRDRFLNVSVQPFPFIFLEVFLVNRKVFRFKYHTLIVSCFQVGEDMEHHLHMDFPWHRHLRQQRQHFSYNVHATYLDHPVQDSDLTLVVIGLFRSQLGLHVRF